jgi:hypothetical protein
MAIVLAFLISFMILPGQVQADTIYLKTGQVVQGKIIDQSSELIKVDGGTGIVVTYYLDGVDKITTNNPAVQKAIAEKNNYDQLQRDLKTVYDNYQKNSEISEISQPATNTAPVPQAGPVTGPTPQGNQIEQQITNIQQSLDNPDEHLSNQLNKYFKTQGSHLQRLGQILKKLASLELVLSHNISANICLFIFAGWFFASYPTMLAAHKLGMENIWMAWVPICQIILLIRMAKEPNLWIYNLIFPFFIIVIPFFFPVSHDVLWFFLGVLSVIASFFLVPAALWCLIAKQIDQPGWFGCLTMIPFYAIFVIQSFADNIVISREKIPLEKVIIRKAPKKSRP